MYDLELAICNNEGIEKFEELELGPLLQHPLVLHYFSVNSDTNEVFHITSEEIINLLSKFLIIGRKKNDFKVEVEEFLEFIARNKSAVGKEMLGIRIQSLGYVILSPHTFIYLLLCKNNFFSNRGMVDFSEFKDLGRVIFQQ